MTSSTSGDCPRDWSNWLVYDTRSTVLIVALIAVAGFSSLAMLPRMEDAVLTKRGALLVTMLPGADPTKVEALVTEKLELHLREVEEIKNLWSHSRLGVSSITIELKDEVEKPDEIWSRVRSKIEDALPELPIQASRPRLDELDLRAFARIVSVVWKLDRKVDYGVLRRTARELQVRLQSVPGTEIVERFGDPGEEVLVEFDPQRAAAVGLSADEIAIQLSSYDAKDAAGLVRTSELDIVLRIGNHFENVSDVAAVDLRCADGRFVRLGQVAEVTVATPRPPPRQGRHGKLAAVSLGASIQPNTRIDAWATKITQVIREFEQSLPDGLRIVDVLDQCRYVDQRFKSLTVNLAFSGLSVFAMILLLMGWRSSIIVSFSLPLTVLAVFYMMLLMGIPIHQVSITGLIIALGLLIDNSIVVVDAVTTERSLGHAAASSVSIAVKRLAMPLLATTLTTLYSFAPIAIMPGPTGEYVASLAVNVILCVFTSLFVALTVVAALAGVFVRVRPTRLQVSASFRDSFAHGFQSPRLTYCYRKFLIQVLKFPSTTVVLSMVIPVAGFAAATQLPEQFFPPAERDQINIELELPHGSAIEETIAASYLVDEGLQTEAVTQIDWYFGENAPTFYYNILATRRGMPNFGQAIVRLESAAVAESVIPRLQSKLDRLVPQARVLARQLEQGPPFDAPVEIRVLGPDLEVLVHLGNIVRSVLVAIPDVTHTRSLLADTLPQVRIDVDSQAASMAGLPPRVIAAQIQASLDGRIGGSIIQGFEELPVRVRTRDRSRSQLAGVRSMDLVSRFENQINVVPLRALAKFTLEPQAGTIVRLNQQRMNEVSGYVSAGVLPSKVLTEFKRKLSASEFALPPGYQLAFGGEFAERNNAVGKLLDGIWLLLAIMIATLVWTFGSFRMATIIGLVGVLSIGMAMASLWIGNYPFGFMAIIGTMGLVGVAINDSIVVLSSLNEKFDRSDVSIEKIADTVIANTRHVIATTVTTVAGFAPLIWGGGEFWPPLAVTISGGVVGATFLALVMVPCAYILCRRSPSSMADSRRP